MTLTTTRAALGAFALGAGLLTAVPLALAGPAAAADVDCSTVGAATYAQFNALGDTDPAVVNFVISITSPVACTITKPGAVVLLDAAGDPLPISQENTYSQSPLAVPANTDTRFLNVTWFNFLCGPVEPPITAVFATSEAAADIHPVEGDLTAPECVTAGSGGQGSRLTLSPFKGTPSSPPPVTDTPSVSASATSRTPTPTPTASSTTSGPASTTGSVAASSAVRTSTPPGQLPYTGSSNIGPLLAAGEATILAGGVMALVLRRRRRA